MILTRKPILGDNETLLADSYSHPAPLGCASYRITRELTFKLRLRGAGNKGSQDYILRLSDAEAREMEEYFATTRREFHKLLEEAVQA